MKVLVTGGGGFVGRDLAGRLIDAGHNVIVSSRDPKTSIPGTAQQQVDELGPNTDWSAALEGVEAVIHLAARVHVMNETTADPMAENRRINTEGSVKLATDAAQAGARHFIFLSTVKVHGEATMALPFQADNAPAPQDPYAIAKLEAEEALREIAEKNAMRLHIIRPPLVYGPGVRGNFLSLLGLCRRGLPLPFGGIDNSRSLIYVGNLSDLICRALLKTDAGTAVYLCRDAEDISTPELFRRVAGALDVSLRIFPFPLPLLRLAGALTGKSAAISRLTESLSVDDAATRSDLDWTPPFSMIQGLKETADWFNNRPTR